MTVRHRETSRNSNVGKWAGVCAWLLVATFAAADDNLNLVFTTTDAGGSYTNRNVHVVWLETTGGGWVTTVGSNVLNNQRALWAQTRANSLTLWDGPNPNPNADVAARTAATQTSYQTYNINWNFRRLDGSEVADGTYVLKFMCTNSDSGNPRNYTSFTITKGGGAWSVGPVSPPGSGYNNVTLTYTPGVVTAPALINRPPSNVTGVSATLNGEVTDTGGEDPTVTAYWGDNDGGAVPGNWDTAVSLGTVGQATFFSNIAGLTGGVTYYYCFSAVNSEGTVVWTTADSFVAQIRITDTIFQEGDIWKYFKGFTFPGATWNDLGFPDGAWLTGRTGIGYGDGDDATVLGDMEDGYWAFYMRYDFSVADPAAVEGLTFTVDYDDAYVAYINGVEVRRDNITGTPNQNTAAAGNHDAGTPEVYDIFTLGGPALAAGPNVFAIEVHNVTFSSSDASMIPELTLVRRPTVTVSDIRLTPDPLAFPPTLVGGFADLTLQIVNDGDGVLQVNALNITGADQAAYSLVAPPVTPFTVAASGGSQSLTVRFAPAALATYNSAAIEVLSDDPDEATATAALEGAGFVLEPDIDLDPVSLDFGAVTAGSSADLSFTIGNIGASVLNVQSLTIVGLSKGGYQLLAPPPIPFSIAAVSGSQTIDVRFAPGSPQDFSHAKVAVGGDDPDEPVALVSLSGVGTAPGATVLPFGGGLGADCRAVALGAGHTVIGQGAMLTLLDATDPANPLAVGDVRLTGLIHDLAVAGSVAYAAGGTTGLLVVDLSTPADPRARRGQETPGHAQSVAVSGATLCLADGEAGLRVYDIAAPETPVLQSVYPTQGVARAVALAGSTAYVLDDQLGLQALDLTDPAAPVLLGALNEIEFAEALAVDGTQAYVIDRLGNFFVVTLANPAAPSLLGATRLAGLGHAVAASGNTVYVAMGGAGLELIDVTNPAAPSSLAVHAAAGEMLDLALSGTTLFAADGFAGLRTLSAAAPSTVTLQSLYTLQAAPRGIDRRDNLTWLADTAAGLQTVDLATAPVAQRRSLLDTLGQPQSVVISGNLAYVANGSAGFQIVDVTTPTAPVLLGAAPTAGFARDVAVSSDTVLVADCQKVYVLDVSDPTSPTVTDEWVSAGGAALGVALDGSYGYVADAGQGLRILDLTDPTSVTVAATYQTPGVAYGVSVTSGIAYVACGAAGLQVLDVSNPAAPAFLGAFDTPGLTLDARLENSLVYLADGPGGVRAIDVSQPAAPLLFAQSHVPLRAWSLAATPNGVAVADELGGPLWSYAGNWPSSFTGATIGPLVAYANNTLTVTATGWTDPEGDPENYYYQWRRNGQDIPGATGATLSNTFFSAGDSITCVVTAWDGTHEGLAIETAPTVILPVNASILSARDGHWMLY